MAKQFAMPLLPHCHKAGNFQKGSKNGKKIKNIKRRHLFK
jgi:hypothetical protein